ARFAWERRARLGSFLLYKAPQEALAYIRGHGSAWGANERYLSQFRDVHQGRRAFVIGMGPSLAMADLDQLSEEITFACNKVYLAFDQTMWRPTYYGVTDVLVASQNRGRIWEQECPKFFPNHLREYLGPSGTSGQHGAFVHCRAQLT